jgi:hypothetical protein
MRQCNVSSNAPTLPLIGIEIEMEGHNLNLNPARTMWKQEGDGSLRGEESIEWILNGPCPLREVRRKLQQLLVFLDEKHDYKHGPTILEPSDRCGVHIHINVQHMTFQEVFNFIFLYLMFEKVLVGYCGASREGNFYCLRASDAEYFIDQMIEARKQSEIELLTPGRDQMRYASVNPGAIRKFGSVEFRAFRTPLNLMNIEEWVYILNQVKESSFKFDEPQEVIERYSARGEEQFFTDIMGEQFSKILRKKVRDVDQKLLDGIRLTQDIAYTLVDIVPITLDEQGKGKNKWERVAPRERNPWREEDEPQEEVDNEEAHPEIEDDQGILDALQEEDEVFADEEGPR